MLPFVTVPIVSDVQEGQHEAIYELSYSLPEQPINHSKVLMHHELMSAFIDILSAEPVDNILNKSSQW